MEENSNLTAERSLEIITQQIAQSRRTVSKEMGDSLFIGGICTMSMAILVGIVNILVASNGLMGIGHLLWFILPIIIWLFSRKHNKEHAKAPVSLVGTMVAKTWSTFAIFVLGFFASAIIFNFIAGHILPPSEYAVVNLKVAPIIVLLMGMAITITGHILKQRWLVVFGIIGGLGCFGWETLEISQRLLIVFGGVTPAGMALVSFVIPCFTIFLFALVGLTIPGLIVKKQRL